MAYPLYITSEDIRKHSSLSGSLDDAKLLPQVKVAMDKHVKNYTGTDLFNRLQEGIENADLTANETTLLTDYVKPMAIHWSLVQALPYLAITISNKGAYRLANENAETLSKEDLDSIVQGHRDTAEHYTEAFIKYMQFNDELFPEYTSNTDDDVNPDKEAYYGGWEI